MVFGVRQNSKNMCGIARDTWEVCEEPAVDGCAREVEGGGWLLLWAAEFSMLVCEVPRHQGVMMMVKLFLGVKV